MKKAFLIILLLLVAAVAVFAVVASMQPAEFRISRSTKITAPPEAVFAQVNDLHKWEAWSPWAKMDPNAKMTFEGPAAGKGAGYTWAGNSKVGEGKMTITDSKPSELVVFQLDFLKPMQGTNAAEFTFKPEGNQTLVTWTMTGTNGFVGKAFGLIVNCDKMVGGEFEKGLAAMKTLVEGDAKK